MPTASLPISHISGAIADEYLLSGFNPQVMYAATSEANPVARKG
ncbi:hypothetical protein [Paenibacillus sp. FSL R7-0331]|nr:hypothetical protein [Paenibacillus sp. FSL R7-0331]